MPQSDNKLLAALPRREYQRLRPLLRTLHLSAETGLPHCGQTRVYFPGTGLCSIINKMGDGGGIEVACIGSEGVVGLPALAGECPNERNGFVHDRLGRARFELKVRFLARAMGVRNSEVAAIVASLEEQGLVRHDGGSITILDEVGLRRHACRCYDAMKRGYTLERIVARAKNSSPPQTARILPMRPGVGVCTLCGSSTRIPHRNGHECILALDEEIAGLIQRTHTLRKYRAQLMANRAQLYRDILKRSSGRI